LKKPRPRGGEINFSGSRSFKASGLAFERPEKERCLSFDQTGRARKSPFMYSPPLRKVDKRTGKGKKAGADVGCGGEEKGPSMQAAVSKVVGVEPSPGKENLLDLERKLSLREEETGPGGQGKTRHCRTNEPSLLHACIVGCIPVREEN